MTFSWSYYGVALLMGAYLTRNIRTGPTLER